MRPISPLLSRLTKSRDPPIRVLGAGLRMDNKLSGNPLAQIIKHLTHITFNSPIVDYEILGLFDIRGLGEGKQFGKQIRGKR